jgi:DNA methylase
MCEGKNLLTSEGIYQSELAKEAEKRRIANLKRGDVPPDVRFIERREEGRSSVLAGKAVGVGKDYVIDAKKVNERAPELRALVMERVITLKDAKTLSVESAPVRQSLVEHVLQGEAKDIKEAKALHKRSVLAERGLSVVLPQHLQLLHGDFMTVGSQIADNSVSLVFTDPPYHEKHLDLWSNLGQFAARVLKPGGLLVAYSGQAFLFSVLSRLSEHLDYRWVLSTYHCGQHIQIWKDQLWNEWKPLVMFSKGKPLEHEWLKDAYTGPKGDKAAHEWAQGEDEADYFIHSLSRPGDIVVDPMCGSGTIIRMAHRLNRRAIGIEINKQRYDVARGTMQVLEEYEEEIA